MKLAPGPDARFGLRLPPLFSNKNRVYSYAAAARTYGDVVRFQYGPVVFHLLRHPDHIKQVLQENHARYHKGRGMRKMKVLLGEGLLTSEGDFWRRQRKLAQPAFHRQKLAALARVMTDDTRAMLDRWAALPAEARSFDVLREMMRLTLRIAARTLFSVDVGHEADRVGRALSIALREANRRTMAAFDFPMWVPTPSNRAYKGAIAELDRVVYGIIEARRKKTVESMDLLGMLMEARDEETGESMSDAQIRNETMTLFLAGHETTANALAWTFYLLSKNPAELRLLEREVDDVLGGRAPTFDDLPRLERTRRVLDESLRLYPPAWLFGRTALEDDVIGGYHVPRGSIVGVSSYLAHRHEAYWSNPEGFDPDRFLPAQSEGRHKWAYVPFGGGPRVCIGNQFALLEATIVLASVVGRFRLSLAPGAHVEPEPLITLRPKNGVPMSCAPRG